MNAKEKLEAAITKLETLSNEFMGEPIEWVVGEDDDGNLAIVGDPGAMNIGLFLFHPDGLLLNGQGGPDEDALGAADLIVTLHRTIDAQLAILRAARILPHGRHDETVAASLLLSSAVALADAILGGD